MRRLMVIFIILLSAGASPGKTRTEAAGDAVQVLLPVSALAATRLSDDAEGTRQFFTGFAANLAATYALKATIDRERPDGSAHNSMPSGHTSASFQAAAFIHERYGFNAAAGAYIGAIFVGYSRVYAERHYPEDVLAGAVLGILSSFTFTTPAGEVILSPAASRNALGLTVTITNP